MGSIAFLINPEVVDRALDVSVTCFRFVTVEQSVWLSYPVGNRRFSYLPAMIIYNVTCKIESAREEEWLKWMRESHVPEVCKAGGFVRATLLRLKFPAEDEGVTYAVQYHIPNMQMLERYLSEAAPGLQADHVLKFGTDVAAFRTILERVGEYGVIDPA